MTEKDAGGLRERKRRATQDAIEHGAIDLALEHGYDNVTVEMICDVATISQRTFFNYVGSKERAVLGTHTPLPSEARRAAYVAGAGGSPLEGLLDTISAAFADFGGTDPALFQKRRLIIQRNPELAIKEFARMEEAQNSIVELVRERLVADSAQSDGAHPKSADDVLNEARMIVSLTFGILHFVVREWVTAGQPADVDLMLRDAVALARKTLHASAATTAG